MAEFPNAKKPWSDMDDKLLELTWGPDVEVKELAKELGRTREAIERRARVLGLRRQTINGCDVTLKS